MYELWHVAMAGNMRKLPPELLQQTLHLNHVFVVSDILYGIGFNLRRQTPASDRDGALLLSWKGT